jgi:hypothetical protein
VRVARPGDRGLVLRDTPATLAFLTLVAANHQEQERRRKTAAVPVAAGVVSTERPDAQETVINHAP